MSEGKSTKDGEDRRGNAVLTGRSTLRTGSFGTSELRRHHRKNDVAGVSRNPQRHQPRSFHETWAKAGGSGIAFRASRFGGGFWRGSSPLERQLPSREAVGFHVPEKLGTVVRPQVIVQIREPLLHKVFARPQLAGAARHDRQGFTARTRKFSARAEVVASRDNHGCQASEIFYRARREFYRARLTGGLASLPPCFAMSGFWFAW